MTPRTPPPVVQSTTARDAIIAIILGALVLGFIVYGVMNMSSPDSGNRLTGTVVAKHFTPAPEKQVEFGRQGIKAREIEGEYLLEVRVDQENRTYQVPVTKSTYESKAVGSKLTFIRPPSEQR